VVKPIRVTAPNSVFALGNALSKASMDMDMTPHFPIYLDYGATTPVDPAWWTP
jgi:hypothetical protein